MPSKRIPTPRPWLKLDSDFLHQDTIEALRDEFGPAGPLTFLAIVCEAKKADLGGTRPISEQGTLRIRTAALARLTGATPDATGAIVRRCVELDLVECLPGTDEATGRYVLRSLKRQAWEPRDATAAARQARKREQSDGESGSDYVDAM